MKSKGRMARTTASTTMLVNTKRFVGKGKHRKQEIIPV